MGIREREEKSPGPEMRISGIAVHEVSAPLNRSYWMSLEPYRTASELIVQVSTDTGLVGTGEIHGRPLNIIRDLVASVLGPMILDRDALKIDDIWQEMFALSHSRRGAELSESEGQPHFGAGIRPQLMAAIAGIDIALWDIASQRHYQPLWRYLGGTSPVVPCYASGGYYGPSGEANTEALVREVVGYAEQGFAAVKIKVGGLDLSEDELRVKAVREALGESIDMMLDANCGYSPSEAIRAAQTFEPYNIRWLEEPVHWYDSVRGTRAVAEASSIPIASGESEIHGNSCRDLIELGGVTVMQFDATRAGGITEWLRVQQHALDHGASMAPHHDPQIHGHLISAAENGLVQEVFPDSNRDPLWNAMFTDKPRITDGIMLMGEQPGLGFGISKAGAKQFFRKTVGIGDVSAIPLASE